MNIIAVKLRIAELQTERLLRPFHNRAQSEELQYRLAKQRYEFWKNKEAEARKASLLDHIRICKRRKKQAKSDMEWHDKMLKRAMKVLERAEVFS